MADEKKCRDILGTTTPIVLVMFFRKLDANILRWYPNSSALAKILSFVARVTRGLSFKALDTVELSIPRALAMSCMVGLLFNSKLKIKFSVHKYNKIQSIVFRFYLLYLHR